MTRVRTSMYDYKQRHISGKAKDNMDKIKPCGRCPNPKCNSFVSDEDKECWACKEDLRTWDEIVDDAASEAGDNMAKKIDKKILDNIIKQAEEEENT